MIDVENITNYNRTKPELEEFLVLAILVAGKTADVMVGKLTELKRELGVKKSWFTTFTSRKKVETALREAKVGQYNRIIQALTQLGKSRPDLSSCTVEDLEAIPGIGPKTARFFLLHSRLGQRYAVLDTHILKWLRDQGHKAPTSTPSNGTYKKWEKVWLSHFPEGSVAEHDLTIWSSRRKKINGHS